MEKGLYSKKFGQEDTIDVSPKSVDGTVLYPRIYYSSERSMRKVIDPASGRHELQETHATEHLKTVHYTIWWRVRILMQDI